MEGIKDYSIRRLAKLNKKEIGRLAANELELMGVRTLSRPVKPVKKDIPTKHSAVILKINKLTKEYSLLAADPHRIYWGHPPKATKKQTRDYLSNMDSLIEDAIVNSVKHEKQYAAHLIAVKEHNKNYNSNLEKYNIQHTDYKEVTKIYNNAKKSIDDRVEGAKRDLKFIEKCAKEYLTYLDVANGDKDMAFRFLTHKHSKASKIENFSAQVLEYVLDTKK